MIASLFRDDVKPRRLETIDVWAVRAIHDALGTSLAAVQIPHMVGIGAYGMLPDVAEGAGIGTGDCWFFPKQGHGGFSMKIDAAGDWVMIRDTLSALEDVVRRIPEKTLETIVGRPVTDLMQHPWLDDTMIVETVVRKPTADGLVLGFVLTNTSRRIDEMVPLLEDGRRP